MKGMLEAHLTFDEAIRSETFYFMRKHRLKKMKATLFDQLEGLRSAMVDQDEIIRVVAKGYGLRLDKNDPILAFLAVHDTLLEANLRVLEAQSAPYTGPVSETGDGISREHCW